MTKEELMIISMLNITSWELNRVKKELEDLDDLVVERNLLRSWVQEKEGLELYGEDLAEVESEIAQNAERRKMLERQHDWYQRRCEWLEKQLANYRHEEEFSSVSVEMEEEQPF